MVSKSTLKLIADPEGKVGVLYTCYEDDGRGLCSRSRQCAFARKQRHPGTRLLQDLREKLQKYRRHA